MPHVCGAGTAYPSGVPGFTQRLVGFLLLNLAFCVLLWRYAECVQRRNLDNRGMKLRIRWLVMKLTSWLFSSSLGMIMNFCKIEQKINIDHDLVNRYIISMSHMIMVLCWACCIHKLAPFSFMTYHRFCNKRKTTDATSGAGTTYPSGVPVFTLEF